MGEADQGTAQGQERLMDIGPPFIADRQPPGATQPGQGPLDHPAVAAQARAGLDPLAGDADLNPPPMQEAATAWHVVGLVGMELGGACSPLTGGLFDERHGVEQVLEDDAVVAVGPGH